MKTFFYWSLLDFEGFVFYVNYQSLAYCVQQACQTCKDMQVASAKFWVKICCGLQSDSKKKRRPLHKALQLNCLTEASFFLNFTLKLR